VPGCVELLHERRLGLAESRCVVVEHSGCTVLCSWSNRDDDHAGDRLVALIFGGELEKRGDGVGAFGLEEFPNLRSVAEVVMHIAQHGGDGVALRSDVGHRAIDDLATGRVVDGGEAIVCIDAGQSCVCQG